MAERTPSPKSHKKTSGSDEKDRDLLRTKVFERLNHIATQYSRAEIARKTGTLPNNVSRYLNSTMPPLEFGLALAAGLNVNPRWLLLGDGVPFLGDLRAEAEPEGKVLLELLDALNAASSLRLGEIGRSKNLKEIRQLSEALDTWRDLRHKLGEKVVPTFQRVINACFDAARREATDELEAHLVVADRLAGFCERADLQADLLLLKAAAKSNRTEIAQALEYQRQSLLKRLAGTSHIDAILCNATYNFLCSMQHVGYDAEVLALGRAFLAMAEKNCKDVFEYKLMRMLIAGLDIEFGNLRSAMLEFHSVAGDIPKDAMRDGMAVILYRMQYYSGAQSTRDFLTTSPLTAVRYFMLCGLAVGDDDFDAVRELESIGRSLEKKGVAPDSYGALAMGGIVQAISAPGSGAHKVYRTRIKSEMERTRMAVERVEFHVAATAGRIALLEGDLDATKEEVLKAEEVMTRMPDGMQPDLMRRALHGRTVLALAARTKDPALEPLARRMRAFLDEYIAKGYLVFKHYLPE